MESLLIEIDQKRGKNKNDGKWKNFCCKQNNGKKSFLAWNEKFKNSLDILIESRNGIGQRKSIEGGRGFWVQKKVGFDYFLE